jgi:hypothetical protein
MSVNIDRKMILSDKVFISFLVGLEIDPDQLCDNTLNYYYDMYVMQSIGYYLEYTTTSK